MHPPHSRRGGFTLVEIMIVVAIIALLSVLALPSLARARTQAQRTRLLRLVKTTAEGFEMYAADHVSKYPYESPTVTAQVNDPYTYPTGMDLYMPKNNTWKSGRDGTWYYYYYPTWRPGYKALIWLYNTDTTDEDVQFIDKALDDGNTATGAVVNYYNTGVVYSLQ